MNKNLLLIFARNPEIGKVKTRLAASIGNQNALEIYNILLNHTVEVTKNSNCNKRVLYSEEINFNDIWDAALFQKKNQFGNDLGARMKNAFVDAFEDEYDKVVIIGTDLYDLQTSDIDKAFEELDTNDIVIGPAEDGGYYLLGLTSIPAGIFAYKNWGTNSVLRDTLKDLHNFKIHLMPIKNDIDTVDDLKNIEFFEKYLNTKEKIQTR